jgi:hypothetical protein
MLLSRAIDDAGATPADCARLLMSRADLVVTQHSMGLDGALIDEATMTRNRHEQWADGPDARAEER